VITNLWDPIIEGLGAAEPFSETAATPSFVILNGISLLAGVLILFGLVGLNLRQSEAAGVLGRVGFVGAFLGTALVVGIAWATVFVVPSLAVAAPGFLEAEEVPGPLNTGVFASFGALSVGWALFGVGALRARIYPWWAAIVLMIAALIQLLPFPGIPLVFGMAVALFGFLSLSGAGISAGESSRAR
jgi:hypothetical protein